MKAATLFLLAFSLALGMAFAGSDDLSTDSATAITPIKISATNAGATNANASGGGAASQTNGRTSGSGDDDDEGDSGSSGSSSGSGGAARGPDYVPTPSNAGETEVSTSSQSEGGGSGMWNASREEDSPDTDSEGKAPAQISRWQLTVTSSNGQALQNAEEIEAVQVSLGRVEVQSRTGNASPALLANNVSGGQVEIEAEISRAHANASSLLRVQSTERETLMQMNGTEVSTSETLRIRGRTMYLERNGTEYRLNVLPSDLAEVEASLAPSQNITLGFEEGVPAYAFRVAERRNFLGIIAVDAETSFTLDARNGSLMREEAPWWAFLAPPEGQLREAISRVSEELSEE
jgi:hypothetical protein